MTSPLRIEFQFDFGSPNAYLAELVLPSIERRTGVKFDYVPVLLGGIYKATGNMSPFDSLRGIKNKPEYQALETERFIRRHNITTFRKNPFFPVNTLMLMRGAVAAKYENMFEPYFRAAYHHMWEDPKKMDDLEIFRAAFKSSGVDIDRLVAFGDPSSGAATTPPAEIVRDVLRTIAPIGGAGAPAQQTQSSRVLVVDDNAANRDLLSRRLTRDGHHVTMAEDGAAALALADSGSFDLVLLDLMMPGLSGFEVLCRLKAEERTRDIPVVMISALDEIDSTVRCIEAGAEDYLPKPFNPVLLRARINACLEKKRLRDRERTITEELRAEKERSEALLLNILPRTIIERLRQGETIIADRVDDATILFADLVDFTSLAARSPPERTVELLGGLFAEFDALAARLGLEKIKTTGDGYMVAGGLPLPEPRPDHAAAVAEMALAMREAAATAAAGFGERLQLRIGVHSGALIAGVIGTHKFVYDVWGDTVNTAKRMESYGAPGRIHVSAIIRQVLGDGFRFEPRGAVEVKGKGRMETYFLEADA